jgi:hypothetical protein
LITGCTISGRYTHIKGDGFDELTLSKNGTYRMCLSNPMVSIESKGKWWRGRPGIVLQSELQLDSLSVEELMVDEHQGRVAFEVRDLSGWPVPGMLYINGGHDGHHIAIDGTLFCDSGTVHSFRFERTSLVQGRIKTTYLARSSSANLYRITVPSFNNERYLAFKQKRLSRDLFGRVVLRDSLYGKPYVLRFRRGTRANPNSNCFVPELEFPW